MKSQLNFHVGALLNAHLEESGVGVNVLSFIEQLEYWRASGEATIRRRYREGLQKRKAASPLRTPFSK